MLVAFKRLNRLATYSARGRIGENHPRFFFDFTKLVVELIVFSIGNGGIVEYVIFVRPFI